MIRICSSKILMFQIVKDVTSIILRKRPLQEKNFL